VTAEPSSSPTSDDHRGEFIRACSLEAVALRALNEARERVAALGEPPVGTPADDRLLTVQEAANFVRCHPNTMYDATRTGRLRSLRVGRHPRFRRADLMAWMEPAAVVSVGLPVPRS
jgi:excisionase family DNA binding protein